MKWLCIFMLVPVLFAQPARPDFSGIYEWPIVTPRNFLIGKKIGYLPREVSGEIFSGEGKLHIAIVRQGA